QSLVVTLSSDTWMDVYRARFILNCFEPFQDLPPFLHDALPICLRSGRYSSRSRRPIGRAAPMSQSRRTRAWTRFGGRRSCNRRRSEEHTSELQSPDQLVWRLLLEKKKERAGWEPVIQPDLGQPGAEHAQFGLDRAKLHQHHPFAHLFYYELAHNLEFASPQLSHRQ